jgi:hypothetical protein
VPEKELDLLKLAAGIMAESCTGAAKIVRRKTRNIHACGGFLDNVPDRLFGDAVAPEFTRPADTSE